VDPLGLTAEKEAPTRAQKALAPGVVIVHPFANGASHITTSSEIARFPGSPTSGGPSGLYMAPENEMDALLARSKSRRDLEVALGLVEGPLEGGV